MRELTMDEMAEIQGGDSCGTAGLIGGAFGLIAFGLGAAAFLTPAGAAAVLYLSAGSFVTGLPAAGTVLGTFLGGCYSS